ncbi:alpha/beta family hydrolase [uncultured Roseibium sp.]|uniref:alpha/beta family hydrolase n=1 Tax=uncultured Roseibium sp. TaxID=1936171 RepID=UPI0032175F8D
MLDFLWTRPETSPLATILLAHGSGAPMDCPFMEKIAVALAGQGFAVARFEFSYMASRRQGAALLPQPLDIELIGEYRTVLRVFMGACEGPILIGGKSMGARVAAKLAAGGFLPDRVVGLSCFGYPLHKANVPDSKWHIGPLKKSSHPILICQGENDPMGPRAELESLSLPAQVTLVFLEGGAHDFKPVQGARATLDENIGNAARATTAFVAGLLPAETKTSAQSENQSKKRSGSLLLRPNRRSAPH